jgi:hypothetical protein
LTGTGKHSASSFPLISSLFPSKHLMLLQRHTPCECVCVCVYPPFRCNSLFPKIFH